jgi:hypothetical protein
VRVAGRMAHAFAALLCALASPALADLDVKAEIGFEGRWVIDAATPLTVTLTNSGADPLDVELAVAQGDEFRVSAEMVHRRRVRVAALAERAEVFLVPGPRNAGGNVHVTVEVDPTVPIHAPNASGDRGTLRFDVAGGGAAYSSDSIGYATHVVGVVGDPTRRIAARVRAAGLGDDAKDRDHRDSHRLEVLSIDAAAQRLAPLGLDGVESLLVCDPDAEFAADPAVAEALLDWVALGGRLVVSLGEHAGLFAASPFAREMPATWTGADPASYEDRLPALKDLGDPPPRVVGPWAQLVPTGAAPTTSGEPRAQAERTVGMGRIVLLAYDLRTAIGPSSAPTPVRALLEPVVDLPPRSTDEPEIWNGTGDGTSLARTLQSGAFEPPPLPLVMLGIVLYVVVVGPLDWFVLKRLKKERLTTLTFLGAVTAFTVLAYGASLALFSTGARVNRVVFVDLAQSGRDGRQIARCVEIAGWYSPTGADQIVGCTQPSAASVVLPGALPGVAGGGDVGAALPIDVMTREPLRPQAIVQLAFRSQRIVRVDSVGPLGATIEVEWDEGGAPRVVNGLPVDLDGVLVYVDGDFAWQLGRVAAGAASDTAHAVRAQRERAFAGFSEDAHPPRASVESFLETITLGESEKDGVDDDRARRRKAGLDRSSFPERGHALVVAFASRPPLPLPGDDAEGDTYVVLRKEVPLP